MTFIKKKPCNIRKDVRSGNIPEMIGSSVSRRCQKHGALLEHWAEGLPEVGLAFKSGEAFQEYAAKHANNWYFYYTRYDSRNMKSSANYDQNKPTYMLFGCRFNKKHYKSQSKGIRKRR